MWKPTTREFDVRATIFMQQKTVVACAYHGQNWLNQIYHPEFEFM